MTGALRAATRLVESGRHLTSAESELALAALLAEGTDEADAAAYLTAMATRRPSPDEVVGAVRHLRGRADAVALDDGHSPVLDVVGTGGDGSGSVNVSTIAALVAVAAGATVAKVGNRAATSRCGSADLLDELGVAVEGGDDVPTRLRRDRFAFLYSRAVHPALVRLAPVRRALGFPTILNLVGPLANPVPLTGRVLGAATHADQDLLAQTCARLGDPATWVVTGHGGTDELTTTGPARVVAVADGRTSELEVDPRDLGLAPARGHELQGGDAAANARTTREVLGGHGTRAVQETCLLNAAAGLHLVGLATDLAAGLELADTALAQGRGSRLLSRLAHPSVSRGPRARGTQLVSA